MKPDWEKVDIKEATGENYVFGLYYRALPAGYGVVERAPT
jgi:hypothetical protein